MKQTKKIIIPNDFSVKPLMLLKRILETTNEDYEIILLSGTLMPNGYAEMLFFRKNKYIAAQKNEEFNQAFIMLKNKFGHRLLSLKMDSITSTNKKYINSYIEANNIQEAYVIGDIALDYKHKNSFDITTALYKSVLPVTAINLLASSQASSYFTNDAADLFIPSLIG